MGLAYDTYDFEKLNHVPHIAIDRQNGHDHYILHGGIAHLHSSFGLCQNKLKDEEKYFIWSFSLLYLEVLIPPF